MLKFVSLFILWDLGFTLAFYTMQVRGQFVFDLLEGGGPCRAPGRGGTKSASYSCRSGHERGGQGVWS